MSPFKLGVIVSEAAGALKPGTEADKGIQEGRAGLTPRTTRVWDSSEIETRKRLIFYFFDTFSKAVKICCSLRHSGWFWIQGTTSL